MTTPVREAVLLINPAARGGAHTHAATAAAEQLRARGIRTTLISGGSAAESALLLRTAVDLGTDAVLVAGGDGTAHLALQVLAGTPTPLGLIPCGTGNDFATQIGLRELDAVGAANIIADGFTRKIDLARAADGNGTEAYFATVLASGFDSRVNDRANSMRWPRGNARYNISILLEFLTLRGIAYNIELELVDGTLERFNEEFVMATIGNGPSYGGGIPICPAAELDDGLLDVTLVRPAGRLRLLRLLPRVYRGTHTTIVEVVTRRIRRARLNADGVTAYADGDRLAPLPLDVAVAPAALTVFAPAQSS